MSRSHAPVPTSVIKVVMVIFTVELTQRNGHFLLLNFIIFTCHYLLVTWFMDILSLTNRIPKRQRLEFIPITHGKYLPINHNLIGHSSKIILPTTHRIFINYHRRLKSCVIHSAW
jgi:hypothetical protein